MTRLLAQWGPSLAFAVLVVAVWIAAGHDRAAWFALGFLASALVIGGRVAVFGWWDHR